MKASENLNRLGSLLFTAFFFFHFLHDDHTIVRLDVPQFLSNAYLISLQHLNVFFANHISHINTGRLVRKSLT